MLKQYELVNHCLSELQRSSLPEKYRWKLEVLLYQLRRLLLIDKVAEMVRDDPDSERDFADLYDAIHNACEPAKHPPALDHLVAVPSEMKKSLYFYCRKGADLHNYSDDGICHLPRQ